MSNKALKPFCVAMGARIKDQRNRIGITQAELSSRMGYKDKSSISLIEAGKSEIATSDLDMLAAVLETDVSYLMGWAETVTTEDERELLSYYRELNDQGKYSARLTVKGLSEGELFKKESGIALNG